MTVKTYERIGDLIHSIKRSKSVINRNMELIDKDFEELNKLLEKNNQPKINLEDIKPIDRYGCDEDEF